MKVSQRRRPAGRLSLIWDWTGFRRIVKPGAWFGLGRRKVIDGVFLHKVVEKNEAPTMTITSDILSGSSHAYAARD